MINDKERYKVQDMETGEYLDMNDEEIEKVKLFFQRKKDQKMKEDFLEYIKLNGFEFYYKELHVQMPLCEYTHILHYRKDNDPNSELMLNEYELDNMFSDGMCRDGIFSELDNNFFDNINSGIFSRLYHYG